MTKPVDRNRLDEAASPYLRQHADNPVDWQPWDEQALAAARERDVPIFLSIGYSACHWCHVMEDESFEDDTVARVLNEHFVPIKVDREERPDVDTIYMTVCQLVTGRGGWPLSAWLTPDGRPFYVGTYFPKESKRGMPGFLDILQQIRHAWQTDRDELEGRADEWTDRVREHLERTPDATPIPDSDTPPADRTADVRTTDSRGDSVPTYDGPEEPKLGPGLTELGDTLLRSTDDEHGGFGSGGPKFPQPRRVEALLRTGARTDRTPLLEAATGTLDAMVSGGLYDHVGGGFHRYCVDADWTVPHFEKMLYDNATISRVLLAGYQVTGDERYASVVRETVEFVDRELTHPDGGCYSTLDAQSPGTDREPEEGAFYLWTPEEVEDALAGHEDASLRTALFCDRYGVTEDGNFEGETVLTIDSSISSLASTYELTEAAVESHLEATREIVFEARANRPRPSRDEKVLAGWNGLLIDAAAEASIVLQDDRYEQQALDALSFVRDHLWDAESNRLSRRYMDGSVAIDGYLEDYAFLARAALTCYEATGAVEYLRFALELARVIVDAFWDEDAGTLYFTPADGESLLVRPQELGDQSTPSPTGVAVQTLLALDPFTDAPFGDAAEAVLATHASDVADRPLQHVSLALAADTVSTGLLELSVVGTELPTEWTDALAETYAPDRLLARRPVSEDALEDWLAELSLDSTPPIWAGRTEGKDEPTVYACRNRACSPPLSDLGEALSWHDSPGPPF